MSSDFEYYADEADSYNVICPWCRSSYQAEAEDFSEEKRDEECSKCGKTFILWDEFDVTHYTKKKK
jgi:hypothetical protein